MGSCPIPCCWFGKSGKGEPRVADAVCLDAGVLVKVLLPEPGSEEAERLLGWALERDLDLIGPAFLLAEVLSVLRKHVHRGALSEEHACRALDALFKVPLDLIDGKEVYERAWRIAGALALPVVCDAVYLACAEMREAVFWTADEALFQQARDRGNVRLLGRDSM